VVFIRFSRLEECALIVVANYYSALMIFSRETFFFFFPLLYSLEDQPLRSDFDLYYSLFLS